MPQPPSDNDNQVGDASQPEDVKAKETPAAKPVEAAETTGQEHQPAPPDTAKLEGQDPAATATPTPDPVATPTPDPVATPTPDPAATVPPVADAATVPPVADPVATATPAPDPTTPPAHATATTGENQSEASGAQAVAHVSTGEEEAPPLPPDAPALILISLHHIIMGVAVICATLYTFLALDRSVNTIFKTGWDQPPNVKLRSGPSAFRYDQSSKQLMHRGPIDDKEKNLLVALAEPRDESYERAVDALAFQTFENSGMVVIFTMVLGGLGGVIGVLMRNISNFLGVACFKKNFDFPVWWPWYVLRPYLAFMTGVVVVILIKSDLLTSPQSATQGSLWFVGLTVLAGFGVDDFLGRLRVLSKTVFPPEETKASATATAIAPTKAKPPTTSPNPSGAVIANGVAPAQTQAQVPVASVTQRTTRIKPA